MPIVIGYGNDLADGLTRAAQAAVPPIIDLNERKKLLLQRQSEQHDRDQQIDRRQGLDERAFGESVRMNDFDLGERTQDREYITKRRAEDDAEAASNKRWQSKIGSYLHDGEFVDENGEDREPTQAEALEAALHEEAGSMDPRDFERARGMLEDAKIREQWLTGVKDLELILQQGGGSAELGAQPAIDPAMAQKAMRLATAGPGGPAQAMEFVFGAMRDAGKAAAQEQYKQISFQGMQEDVAATQARLSQMRQLGVDPEVLALESANLESKLTELNIFERGMPFIQSSGVRAAEQRFYGIGKPGSSSKSSSAPKQGYANKPRAQWDEHDWYDRAADQVAKSGVKFETFEDYTAAVDRLMPAHVKAQGEAPQPAVDPSGKQPLPVGQNPQVPLPVAEKGAAPQSSSFFAPQDQARIASASTADEARRIGESVARGEVPPSEGPAAAPEKLEGPALEQHERQKLAELLAAGDDLMPREREELERLQAKYPEDKRNVTEGTHEDHEALLKATSPATKKKPKKKQ